MAALGPDLSLPLSAFLFPLIAVFSRHMLQTILQDIDNCYGHDLTLKKDDNAFKKSK